jgi:hypothetical protein
MILGDLLVAGDAILPIMLNLATEALSSYAATE